jgi:hypothetical protein
MCILAAGKHATVLETLSAVRGPAAVGSLNAGSRATSSWVAGLT